MRQKFLVFTLSLLCVLGSTAHARHTLSGDEIGLVLAKEAPKQLRRGQRVTIYLGMGYNELIGRLPDGKVLSVTYGPYKLSKKDKATEAKIRKLTRPRALYVKVGGKWKKLREPNDLWPLFSVFLARHKLSAKDQRAYTSYRAHGNKYYIDFKRMVQVNKANPSKTRPVRFFAR